MSEFLGVISTKITDLVLNTAVEKMLSIYFFLSLFFLWSHSNICPQVSFYSYIKILFKYQELSVFV